MDILVEVKPDPRIGEVVQNGALTDRLSSRIDEIGESLTEVATSLHRRLERDLAVRPAGAWELGRVEIGFSIDLRSDGGVIVARESTSPGFKVSLTWTPPVPA
ncbi:MAG TPA: CU044_2847 family protein [Candidatus Dormibacteraeota bacterium]